MNGNCINGHKKVPTNWRKDKSGRWYCSECARKVMRKQRASWTDEERAAKYEFVRIYKREQRRQQKAEAIAGYGGSCSWCSEDIQEFLTLDHVNNDGAAHRKEIGKAGGRLYRWAIDNGFPDRLRVLCFNCNCSRDIYGDEIIMKRLQDKNARKGRGEL